MMMGPRSFTTGRVKNRIAPCASPSRIAALAARSRPPIASSGHASACFSSSRALLAAPQLAHEHGAHVGRRGLERQDAVVEALALRLAAGLVGQDGEPQNRM